VQHEFRLGPPHRCQRPVAGLVTVRPLYAGLVTVHPALVVPRIDAVIVRAMNPVDEPAEQVAESVDAARAEERQDMARQARQDAERDATLADALEKAKNTEWSR
jgi:hypothetical protein